MTVLLGVDFGTSNTVAVLRFPDGRSRPLLFDGSPIMPSAVFADEQALLIGRDAEHSARIHPERFEPNPKRRIDDGTVLLGGRQVEVVDLFAAVLRRVLTEANRITGGTDIQVTLTHPAGWGTPRTGVLLAAAARAGMRNPRLVPEPVAAAAYFLHALKITVPVGGSIVVYDFGAGTFDASVVRREPNGFSVLASEGLNDAGGLDIDAAVAGHLGATIVARDAAAWRRLDQPETDADRRALRLFREDVRAAKEILSRTASTYVHVPLIDDSLPIGREQLETLARPVLDRTVAATGLVIRRAALPAAPAAIFLVGGSSRIPLAATLLHQQLGILPSAVEQPELVVADGSVHAAAVVAPPAPVAPVSAVPASAPPRPTYPPQAAPATPASPYAQPRPVIPTQPTAPPVAPNPATHNPAMASPAVPAPATPTPAPAPAGYPAAGYPPVAPATSPPASVPPASVPPSSVSPASAPPGYPTQPGYAAQPGYPTTAAQPGSPGVPGGALPPGSGTGWPPVPPPQPPRRGRGRTIALVTVPALLVVAALVAVLVLKPWQTDHPEPPLGQHTTKPISYEAADNTGPAARPAGAVHGGQLTVLTTSSFDHLDPAQVYFFDEEAFLQLVVRTLTAVRTNPDGTGTLVGDLATDPGTDVDGDCRTWRYTLRDGVQFADGTPITSHDVAYGIARSFDPDLISGFTTLQRWLAGDDYNAGYTGPGSGDRQPPGVHTPDERTIELTFPTPHCDLPYAASLPTTAPIPDGSQPSASTVDDKPPSSGPYQVSTHTGSTVTLTRNPHWVAATDPLRTADPDVIVLKLSQDGTTMASKLIADGDADQASLAWSTTDTADARATGRTITGSLGYNLLLAINTKRVTSLDVRKGIAYAIDKNQLIGETVGTDRAEPATSVIPAGFAGYQQNPEAFPFDPARAKTLVNAPSSELKLTVVSSTNSERDRELTLLKNMLRPAGIYLTATQVDTTDFFSTVDDPADPYDMALVTWSPDWPSGYQQLRDMFGRQPIWDVSHLSDPSVYSEFDRLDKLPLDQQLAQAGDLDAMIVSDTVAVVPLFGVSGTYLHGSHVGAVPVSAAFGQPDLLSAWVTP